MDLEMGDRRDPVGPHGVSHRRAQYLGSALNVMPGRDHDAPEVGSDYLNVMSVGNWWVATRARMTHPRVMR